mgnify:CR=1 FL=1
MSGAVRVIASAILYSVIARADRLVAISSQSTIDNVDSVLPLRRFFTSFRMTMLIEFLDRRVADVVLT